MLKKTYQKGVSRQESIWKHQHTDAERDSLTLIKNHENSAVVYNTGQFYESKKLYYQKYRKLVKFMRAQFYDYRHCFSQHSWALHRGQPSTGLTRVLVPAVYVSALVKCSSDSSESLTVQPDRRWPVTFPYTRRCCFTRTASLTLEGHDSLLLCFGWISFTITMTHITSSLGGCGWSGRAGRLVIGKVGGLTKVCWTRCRTPFAPDAFIGAWRCECLIEKKSGHMIVGVNGWMWLVA